MISINDILASTLIFAIMSGSSAFTYNSQGNVYRIQTSLHADSSSALHYRHGSDATYAPSTLLYASVTTNQDRSEDIDIEHQIEAALNNARDMDRKFGLCTQPSIRAWQIVDELYMKSAVSQKIEDCVKSALGTEKNIWNLYG